jgi:hypothetical protein
LRYIAKKRKAEEMKNMIKWKRWIILAIVCIVTITASEVIIAGSINDDVAAAPPASQPFKYVLELGGITVGTFDTASLSVARGVVEYQDGNEPIVVRKDPQNLVECGYIMLASKPSNPALDVIWAKFQNPITAEDDWECPTCEDGWLRVIDPGGVEVERYKLTCAWPCEWYFDNSFTDVNCDGKDDIDHLTQVKIAVDIITRY